MIDEDGLDDDASLDEITVPNLPTAGNNGENGGSRNRRIENNVGSGTLVDDVLLPLGVVSETNKKSGGSLISKTKKNSQVKVPNLYVGVEERRQLLIEQEATNKFHKFVEGNLILKQGMYI